MSSSDSAENTTPSGDFTPPVVTGFDVGAAPAGHSVSDIQVGFQNAVAISTAKPNDEDENDFDNLPKSIINRLIALKSLQEESDKIEEQYKLERVALEKKYRELKTPQWEKRQQIVNGEVEVESLVKEDVVVEGEEPEKVVGIPSFWMQCLQNHPNIGELITDDDATALGALRDIKCEYNEDMSGFKLIFVFAENEYFSNKELTKSYTVSPDLLDEKAPALTNVEGTTIDWKDPAKNLCVSVERKKQRAKSGKRQGQVRYVTSLVDKESFFHYFKEPTMNAGEEEDEGDEEGEPKRGGSSKFTLSIDEDYEIGHAIRTAIIPEAVLWFTGEAAGDEDDDFDDVDEEGDEGDDDEDDDEEGDDDDDPDEESEEVSKPSKGKKGWRGAGAPAAPGTAPGEPTPECKQN